MLPVATENGSTSGNAWGETVVWVFHLLSSTAIMLNAVCMYWLFLLKTLNLFGRELLYCLYNYNCHKYRTTVKIECKFLNFGKIFK